MRTFFEGALGVTKVGTWQAFGRKLFQQLELGHPRRSCCLYNGSLDFTHFHAVLRENPNQSSTSQVVPCLLVSLF